MNRAKAGWTCPACKTPGYHLTGIELIISTYKEKQLGLEVPTGFWITHGKIPRTYPLQPKISVLTLY